MLCVCPHLDNALPQVAHEPVEAPRIEVLLESRAVAREKGDEREKPLLNAALSKLELQQKCQCRFEKFVHLWHREENSAHM